MLRHRRLLNLIDHLPPDSAFAEAIANDPVVAEGIREGRIRVGDPEDPDGKSEKRPAPKISEWSPEMSLMAEMVDRLGTLITLLYAQGGGKNLPKIPPAPRPVTEIDKAARDRKAREKREKTLEIIRTFLPDHENVPLI